MFEPPRRVAIVGGARIPFARANTAYAALGNQDMLAAALKALVDRYNLAGALVGEVAAGAVIKHSRDWNLAREATLDSGLDPHTPAYDVQRRLTRTYPGPSIAGRAARKSSLTPTPRRSSCAARVWVPAHPVGSGTACFRARCTPRAARSVSRCWR